MEDSEIVALYWARSENAVARTAEKYGTYCYAIAYNILGSREDSEECVNDTYLRAWDAMPPQRPGRLAAFLGKITRNLSLDRYRHDRAEKRGLAQAPAALEELRDCVPALRGQERTVDDLALAELLNGFLASLPAARRALFLRRYWYFSPVKEIARDLGMTESNVKMMALRLRRELRAYLEKEGISL